MMGATDIPGYGPLISYAMGGVSPADDIHHLYGCPPTQDGLPGDCPGLLPAVMAKFPHCTFEGYGQPYINASCSLKVHVNKVTNSETCSDSGKLADGTPVDCAKEFPWADATTANSKCINNPCTEEQRVWNNAKLHGVATAGDTFYTAAIPRMAPGNNFNFAPTAAAMAANKVQCAKQAACQRTCDTCHVSTLDVTVTVRVDEPRTGARRSLESTTLCSACSNGNKDGVCLMPLHPSECPTSTTELLTETARAAIPDCRRTVLGVTRLPLDIGDVCEADGNDPVPGANTLDNCASITAGVTLAAPGGWDFYKRVACRADTTWGFEHRDQAEAVKNDCEYFANQANHQASWRSTAGFLQLIELNADTGDMLKAGKAIRALGPDRMVNSWGADNVQNTVDDSWGPDGIQGNADDTALDDVSGAPVYRQPAATTYKYPANPGTVAAPLAQSTINNSPAPYSVLPTNVKCTVTEHVPVARVTPGHWPEAPPPPSPPPSPPPPSPPPPSPPGPLAPHDCE